MTPAAILLLVQGVEAAVSAAPQVIAVVEQAKAFIDSLVTAQIITTETQAQIHAHVDAVQAAALAGTPPPEFTVEKDPTN